MIFQYGLCPFAPHRAMTKNGIGIGELGVCFVFAPIFERQNGNAFLQDLRSRGGSNFLSSEPLISKYADDQEQDGDDDKVEFPSGAFGDRLGNIHIFGAFEPFGGQFERPGKNQRDDKPDHQEQYDQSDRPARDLEKWKDLCGHLNQQPGDNRVRDRDLVHVAPP
jgi:hypothetical protein